MITGPIRARPGVALVSASAAALLVSMSPAARAQTVDYGALEKLFDEPVTMSATGSPQRVSEAPADMEIVTSDDIIRSGAIDLPGVLRHVAGVDVLQWSNAAADVSVRGYNQPYSPRLLVLIDGRQVYADYYGLTPWTALPVELGAIRQIEVVKGPNSALFGFNAVGGVINIITSSPLYDNVNTATLRAGTDGLAEGAVVSTLKLGSRAGLRIEASGRSMDDFSTPGAQSVRFNRPGDDRGSIDANGLMQVSDDVQFGLEGSYTRAGQTEMVPSVYNVGFTRYRTESIKGQLTADTQIGLVQGTAYTNWIHADIRSVNSSVGDLALLADNEVTVAQLQDLFKVGSDHTFRVSAEYRHNSVNTTPTAGGQVAYDVASGGVMWDWKILPTLSLTDALRLDYLTLGRSGPVIAGLPLTNSNWNRTLTEASYNSGIVWQPSDVDTLRITASRGVQLPNLEDLGAIQTVVTRTPILELVAGNPALEPTVVDNYEIGWDRILPDFDAMLRVSAFIQSTDDAVSNLGKFTLIPGGFMIASANIGDSNAEGVELALKGQIAHRWHWGLSYTPEIITDHFVRNSASTVFPVDFQHTAPTHVVNANLGWTDGRWEVDGFLRYESRFYGIAPYLSAMPLVPIEDYVSIDARVGYHVTDWGMLSLSGQNIGQSNQRQTVAPNVQRRVVGSVSVNF